MAIKINQLSKQSLSSDWGICYKLLTVENEKDILFDFGGCLTKYGDNSVCERKKGIGQHKH